MTYQVALTMESRNEKTGKIPVSTTTYATCPDACPLRQNGCYAGNGPLGMAWHDFIKVVFGMPLDTLWRHNQAGDLPGNRIAIDETALKSLVLANAGKRGFTYTHYDVVNNTKNREAVSHANKSGFTVNLSANNLKHADALADTKAGPVVVVLPSSVNGPEKITTPAGRKVTVCPATYRDDVTCKSCGLCALQRDTIVGFPAHGVQKKRADAIAA
jgi:hypothetical protein